MFSYKYKGNKVAVKRIRKDHNTRISPAEKEFDMMIQLKGHKNIVEFFDIMENQDEFCLIMEYMSGGDLKHLISTRIEQNKFLTHQQI